MSNGWKAKIEGLLRDEMRYCFNYATIGGMVKFELNETEFAGPEDRSASGFLDHVLSLVQDIRREMYKLGYLDGARDGSIDSGVEAGLTFSEEINQITAERRFNERDK